MDSELAQTKVENGAPINRIFLGDLDIPEMPRIPPGRSALHIILDNCSLEVLDINQDCQIHMLSIWNCPRLRRIRTLPNEISHIQIIECAGLEQVDMIPEGVITVEISGSPLLRSVPRIPPLVRGFALQNTGVKILPRPDDIHPELAIIGGPFRIQRVAERSLTVAWKHFWRLQDHMMAGLKEEIIAAAWHPKRLGKWLEAGGWDLVESLT